MTDGELCLSIALSDNERTRPLIDGRVRAQGVRLIPSCVHPSEMFWRQLRFGDFDVSEMSLSSLFIAVARGDTRWVALPIYTARNFFHTTILVRADSDITQPADLKGKRVGVPEYQQTWAVWSRGILEHEFGVHARDIEWHMERGPDKSHAGSGGFIPPPGVRLHQIPATTNIGEMMVKAELDATLLYLNSSNLVDRSNIDLARVDGIRPLFADPAAEMRRYYEKSGLYPINHTVVVRRELLDSHPWLAINLFHAFSEAKKNVERDAALVVQPYLATGMIPASVGEALAQDPKPYGLKSARRELETLAQFVHEQGLADRVVALDEIFPESVLEL